MKMFLFVLVFFTFTSSYCADIRMPNLNVSVEPWTPYVHELLKSALKLSENKNNPDKYFLVSENMAQDRALNFLKKNDVFDVFWTMTSKQREEGLLPIRIPVMKGLLGYRLLIIRNGEEERFKNIRTLQDLKTISMGQGFDWPDTAILRAAGMNVITTSNYDGLFGMLAGKKFDAFPQGINEVWDEVRDNKILNIKTEESILIVYPAPFFFFVSKENQELHDRIEKGLKKMIENNSLNKLFFKYWDKEIKLTKINNRKVFRLPNPLLSAETQKMLDEHPEYLLSIKH